MSENSESFKKSLDELIEEFDSIELEEGTDYFSALFKMQQDLQKFYRKDYENLSLEERAKFVRDNWSYLTTEMGELFNAIPYFKYWKDHKGKTTLTREERMNILFEYVDILHFVLNIAVYLGLTSEEIIKGYIVKNRENRERKKRGY